MRKTLNVDRNDLALLQSVFSLAEDNDLIEKSPVRKKHKPTVVKNEKPVWTPEQVRKIVDSVPAEYGSLFTCAALTGVRLGELLGLQWKHIDFGTGVLEIRQALWNGQLVARRRPAACAKLPSVRSCLRPLLPSSVARSSARRTVLSSALQTDVR